jgi:flavin-dependent dehydrogenase
MIAGKDWDVAIIGAGPAGGVAAAVLAARGFSVVMIERSAWPRDKVCGGCVNAAAVGALKSLGLESAIAGSQPLDEVVWHVGDDTLRLAAPGGAAILRGNLDAAIVGQAVARSCTFLPATSATLLPGAPSALTREIQLRNTEDVSTISAKMVLACDGIGGTSLARETWAGWKIARRAWIGVSTTCDGWPADLEKGAIHMHVAGGGYVGLVRLGDERVHLAAAIDPSAARAAGGPGLLIEQILQLPLPSEARFKGTAELTRRRVRVAGHRVLAVGDSCGYVEPFTGEGMAWAIESARRAAELLPAPGAEWPDDLADQWQAIHNATILRRQRWCRRLRPMMHHPALAAVGVALGNAAPAVGSFITSRIQGGVA